MSFADPNLPRAAGSRTESGTASRARSTRAREARAPRAPSDESDPTPIDRPRGSPYRRSVDWEHVGLLGAGLLIGALVGAGAALLLAPQSGAQTRTTLRRKARVARYRANDAWDDLAGELAAVARRGGRRARRAMQRARWRASDAID
jgi:hypothetical protein